MKARWLSVLLVVPAFVGCASLDAPTACQTSGRCDDATADVVADVADVSVETLVDSGAPEADVAPDVPDAPVDTPVDTPPPPPKVSLVAAGQTHACALLADKSVRCWGANNKGQLGRDPATTSGSTTPLAVTLPGPADALASGDAFSCAVVGGGVYCWGTNSAGQVGLPVPGSALTFSPHRIDEVSGTFEGVVDVVAGGDFACARLSTGKMGCWGASDKGQLGSGSTTLSTQASSPLYIKDVTSMSANGQSAFIVFGTNAVRCWGANDSSQLGTGDTTTSPIPTSPSGTTTWSSFGLGLLHGCGIATDASLLCWGSNSHGQAGQPLATTKVSTPTAVSAAGLVAQVSGGDFHTCWVKKDKSLYCLGGNGSGQISIGKATANELTPQAVKGLTSVQMVSARGSFTCSVDSTQQLWCWGANDKGQLGDGTLVERDDPTLVKW